VWSPHWRSVDQMGPSKTTPNLSDLTVWNHQKPIIFSILKCQIEAPLVTFGKPSSETSGNCSILNGYYGYYHPIEAPFSAALPLVTGCQPGWISSPWPQWRLHTCRTWEILVGRKTWGLLAVTTWDLSPGLPGVKSHKIRPSAKCRKVACAEFRVFLEFYSLKPSLMRKSETWLMWIVIVPDSARRLFFFLMWHPNS